MRSLLTFSGNFSNPRALICRTVTFPSTLSGVLSQGWMTPSATHVTSAGIVHGWWHCNLRMNTAQYVPFFHNDLISPAWPFYALSSPTCIRTSERCRRTSDRPCMYLHNSWQSLVLPMPVLPKRLRSVYAKYLRRMHWKFKCMVSIIINLFS